MYYTIPEAAQRLRLSPRTLRRIIADSKIKHDRQPGHNGKVLFTEEHINQYINTYYK